MRKFFFTTFMLLGAVSLSAQDGSVTIAVPRANVRGEANEKSGVLMQVTAGTVLVLKAVEADWFKVELPPDPRLNGMRVQGYLSRKVATMTSAPVAAPVTAGGVVRVPDYVRGGMSVALQTGSATSWLTPETATVRAVDPAVGSLRALIGILPMNDVPPAGRGAAPMTFVWVLGGATAPRVLETRRPTFLAMFKDVSGITPEALSPILVRLTPAPSGVRLVAAARGRADQADRADVDWEVMRDLRHDPVRATVELAEPGAARLGVPSDLEPGEYAVVFRPIVRTRLSGSSVLGPDSALFRTVWGVSVR